MGARSSPRAKAKSKPVVRLLFTCVGRRVELVRAFEAAGKALRLDLEIHAADASAFAPAMHCVDRTHVVPAVGGGGYVDALAAIIRRSKIHLLVPLLDIELPLIAAAAGRFAELGCRAVISSETVVRTCRDKLTAFRALRDALIDTPDTWTLSEALRFPRHRFPYYLKPRTGSAAMGNYVIHTIEELHTFGRRVPDALVQEFVDGVEHTLDVYTGFDGVPRIVVPRRRLEVRTGEVSKGVTVKDPAIMAIGRRVAEVLGECRGVITVQCIVTPDGRIRVLEINPRFGGGVPLAIRAGADFPKWMLLEHLGRKARIVPTAFRHDLAMLRFDESVFVANASRLLARRHTG
jgi:carbamoyl-phosphate synthase large subunit